MSKSTKVTEPVKKAEAKEEEQETKAPKLPATAQKRRELYEALKPVVERDADLISIGKNPDDNA